MDLMMNRRRMMMSEREASEYIKDGLVLWLDGIDKGADDGSWVDLVAGHVFTKQGSGEMTYADSYLHTNNWGKAYFINTSFTPPEAIEGTFEAVVSSITGLVFVGKSPTSSFFARNRNSILWTSEKNYDSASWGNDSFSINAERGYRNGALLSAASSTTNWPTAYADGTTNSIGRFPKVSYYNGGAMNLYCIRIYNRKLTEAEMRNNLKIDNVRFNLGLTL